MSCLHTSFLTHLTLHAWSKLLTKNVYVCARAVCMYVIMCVCTYACGCTCSWRPEVSIEVSCFIWILLVQLDELASELQRFISFHNLPHLSVSRLWIHTVILIFYVDTRHLNSGFHVCPTNILLTKQYHQFPEFCVFLSVLVFKDINLYPIKSVSMILFKIF